MIENVLLLKLIHVLSSTVLFGTGLGVAYFMLMACRSCDPIVVAHTASIVVMADAVFIANAAIVQPVSGVQLALAIGYSLSESWIVASFVLYAWSRPAGCRCCGSRCRCAILRARRRRRGPPCRRAITGCSASGSCWDGRPSSA